MWLLDYIIMKMSCYPALWWIKLFSIDILNLNNYWSTIEQHLTSLWVKKYFHILKPPILCNTFNNVLVVNYLFSKKQIQLTKYILKASSYKWFYLSAEKDAVQIPLGYELVAQRTSTLYWPASENIMYFAIYINTILRTIL